MSLTSPLIDQAIALRIPVRQRPPIELWRKSGSLSCSPSQAAQFFLTDPTFRQEHPEYLCQPRRAKLISPVDVLTTLGQVALQVPHVGRFLDLVRHLFCFPHDALKFPLQSSVEGFPGDGPFQFHQLGSWG